jgi:toxin YoeB
MAQRKVVWTRQAEEDRLDILEYWFNRNKSIRYSKKLNALWVAGLELVAKTPFIGRKTEIANVRAKLVKDYYLIYRISPSEIHVLTIWDCSQNPEKLEFNLER